MPVLLVCTKEGGRGKYYGSFGLVTSLPMALQFKTKADAEQGAIDLGLTDFEPTMVAPAAPPGQTTYDPFGLKR